jgi:hypothetical protein
MLVANKLYKKQKTLNPVAKHNSHKKEINLNATNPTGLLGYAPGLAHRSKKQQVAQTDRY